MNDTQKLIHCIGCRDDYYNDRGGTKRCWSLETAQLKKRFETGTWTDPTKPGAFTQIEVLSCFNATGRHFTDKLPACAVDPVLIKDSTQIKEEVKCIWVDDLKPAPCGCKIARTYEEALELLRSESWDILYLDYDLGAPGCNGVALIEEMVESSIPIPPSVRPISHSNMGNMLIRQAVEDARTKVGSGPT